MKKNEETGAMTLWHLWPQAVTGLIVSAVLLVIAAWIVSAGILGESNLRILAAVSCFAGTMTGAFLAAKRFKKSTLLVGVLCGMALFIALFLLGCLFSFSVTPSESTLQILLAAMLGGLAGGFLGGMKPKKKR